MKVSTMFPSSYLKAPDLVGSSNPEPVLEIVRVSLEEMPAFDDEPVKERPVAWFKETDKGMVLNVTNANMIAFLHGDDTDEWIGKKIQLHTPPVAFRGKSAPGLRVKDSVPSGDTDDADIPF